MQRFMRNGRTAKMTRQLLLRGVSTHPQGGPRATPALGSAEGAQRSTLVLGGIGLSILALAHAEFNAASEASEAKQCDAGKDIGFTLPLDAETFETVAAKPGARIAHVCCASYKANFPIEDKFDVHATEGGDVYALVLDGHGGWQVSEYARKVLIGNVQKEVEMLTAFKKTKKPQDASETATPKSMSKHQVASAIQRGFGRTDRDLLAKVSGAFQLGFGAVGRCGSCALMVLVRGDTLHVANAGDVRAVLGKKGRGAKWTAVALTQDQNAMSNVEQERLKREHPGEEDVVVCRSPDSCYIKGALQPTRAFGDFSLKYAEFNGPAYVNGDRSAGHHTPAPFTPPYVTSVPEMRSLDIQAEDEFVIIGSDGVWDFLTNEEAVEAVREALAHGTPERAGRAVVEKTLQKAATRGAMTYAELVNLAPGDPRRPHHDDTTVIVMFLK